MEISSLSLIIIAIILLICITSLFLYQKPLQNLPPGPRGLPIIGCFLWIYNQPLDSAIDTLHKKYGDIVSLYIGSKLVVFLGTRELMHEAYVVQGETFSGKPHHSPMEIDGDERGVSLSDGPLWKEQRCFVMKILNDFGMGKEKLEPEIMQEIKQFMNELRKTDGEPVYLHELLGTSISNVICILEFGKRFEYTDEAFKSLKRDLTALTFSLEVFHLPMHFPWMKYLPLLDKLPKPIRMKKLKSSLNTFADNYIQLHETNSSFEEHRDFIYAWLDERAERSERHKTNEYFTKESLRFNLISLFIAGTQTTMSTLLTGIALMIKHQDAQEKCRNEIFNVIGTDATPTLAQKDLLPYTQATLLEIQRFARVNPYNLAHRTKEDTNLMGYNIPKDSIIYGNIRRVHSDPQDWPEPDRFLPERFLSDEGTVINRDKIMPFSIGKRICLGAALARTEIFLYFTALLQNFKLSAPDPNNFTLEYYGDLLRSPKHFTALCKPI